MRGQLPNLRSGRGLLVVAVATFVVATGCGSSSSDGTTTRAAELAEATFPGYRMAFRYPANWKRRGWCWVGTSEFPLALLTTARLPHCSAGNLFGFQTPLPPPMRLGPNGVAAWWAAFPRRVLSGAQNARVAGKPALILVRQEPTKRTPKSYVNCRGSGPEQRRLTAEVHGPGSGVGRVELGAVICGPNFAAGEAKVRQMLDSLRFTR